MITTDIILSPGYSQNDLESALAGRLGGFAPAMLSYRILKERIDVSCKSRIICRLTVGVTLDEDSERALLRRKKLYREGTDLELVIPRSRLDERPVVVGFGPCGIFAALILAEAGARPMVLERGLDADGRAQSVKRFNETGMLDSESNIQFGEGGAGAFSDGKLKYGVADKYKMKVLTELVAAGAPEEILYSAGAHIGTDRLPSVIKKIRNKIISLGGEVIFSAKVGDILTDGGRVRAIEYEKDGKTFTVEADNVILAAGHSARDVFTMLRARGVLMSRKGIGVGVRIEHPQSLINELIYGDRTRSNALGAVSYRLVTHLQGGRSVYSFCMCPGGSVVAAASEQGGVVTNGMSAYARDLTNANAAFLVSVLPSDYGGDDPLAGIEFQRRIEQGVFGLCEGYKAPVQLLGDFMKKENSSSFGAVYPTYPRGTFFKETDSYLPSFVTDSLRLAMPQFEAYLPGFVIPDAVMTGAETRSTSPVRIERNESRQAVGMSGLYPCGEGSGHAGGIVSSAADGIISALALLEK